MPSTRRILAALAIVGAVVAGAGQLAVSVVCACTAPSPEAARWPAVTGSTAVGGTLSTSDGTWVASGNLASYPNTGYTYQWQRCDSGGSSCVDIASATASTYTLVSGDSGHTIRAVITATNSAGKTKTQASAPSAVVTGGGGQTTNCLPAAAGTMTNAISHLCGFADTTNSGVPAGTTLYRVPADITAPTTQTGSGWTYSAGDFHFTSGAVLKNVQYAGCIDVNQPNVTIEDSDIQAVCGVGTISVRSVNNITIQYNNIHGTGASSPNGTSSGIKDVYGNSNGDHIDYNNIWYASAAINNFAEGGSMQGNYTHDPGYNAADSHIDGIQMEDGNGGSTMLIKDNTLLVPDTQSYPLGLANDGATNTDDNRQIDHNLMAGGGYCFYGAGGDEWTNHNVVVTNNHFSRLYYSGCGYGGGPVVHWSATNGNVWGTGNVWDDTGAAITP